MILSMLLLILSKMRSRGKTTSRLVTIVRSALTRTSSTMTKSTMPMLRNAVHWFTRARCRVPFDTTRRLRGVGCRWDVEDVVAVAALDGEVIRASARPRILRGPIPGAAAEDERDGFAALSRGKIVEAVSHRLAHRTLQSARFDPPRPKPREATGDTPRGWCPSRSTGALARREWSRAPRRRCSSTYSP